MQDIFTNDGDHTLFDNLLNKKSTIVISIKIFNKVSNEELIIAFASITKQGCFTCYCILYQVNRSSTKKYFTINQS